MGANRKINDVQSSSVKEYHNADNAIPVFLDGDRVLYDRKFRLDNVYARTFAFEGIPMNANDKKGLLACVPIVPVEESAFQIWKRYGVWSHGHIKYQLMLLAKAGMIQRRKQEISNGFRWIYCRRVCDQDEYEKCCWPNVCKIFGDFFVRDDGVDVWNNNVEVVGRNVLTPETIKADLADAFGYGSSAPGWLEPSKDYNDGTQKDQGSVRKGEQACDRTQAGSSEQNYDPAEVRDDGSRRDGGKG